MEGGNWFNQTVGGSSKSFLVYRSKCTSTVFRAVMAVTQMICPSVLAVAFGTVPTQTSLQRAWHTRSPPSSPGCSPEPDLWQELPKAVLTSVCSAKCLWKPHSKPHSGFMQINSFTSQIVLLFQAAVDACGEILRGARHRWQLTSAHLVSVLFSSWGQRTVIFPVCLYCAQIKDLYCLNNWKNSDVFTWPE